jgi:hypothetical protein
MPRPAAILSLVLVAFTSTACTPLTVPPPSAPEPSLPPVDAPATSADSGLGSVVFSTDVPAKVWKIEWVAVGGRGGTSRSLLCTATPCSVTLPHGDHEIAFTAIAAADDERASTAVVHVSAERSVVNHTLGRVHTSSGRGLGIGLVLVGSLSMIIGGAIVGAAQKKGDPSLQETGGGTLLAGLGGLALGGTIMAANRTEVQDGATTQWSPGKPTKTVGASLGFKF